MTWQILSNRLIWHPLRRSTRSEFVPRCHIFSFISFCYFRFHLICASKSTGPRPLCIDDNETEFDSIAVSLNVIWRINWSIWVNGRLRWRWRPLRAKRGEIACIDNLFSKMAGGWGKAADAIQHSCAYLCFWSASDLPFSFRLFSVGGLGCVPSNSGFWNSL